ncbi:MAG: EAL domain-containing protein [Pelomonas sp.]|nr:EAL domain-containing protein [Roseateles sp.]MBV8469034.1 EAL domain-containing protein [Burkholderiaceae bacterium]MBV8605083.1 EAL domain-containing protein [Roseateles sp.]
MNAPLVREITALRSHRMMMLFKVVMSAQLAAAASYALLGAWDSLVVLGCSILGVSVAWWLASRGRHISASFLFLATLTCMVVRFVWRNGGLRDPSMLAIPGILMLASLVGGRRALYGALAVNLVLVAMVSWGNLGAWHPNQLGPMSWQTVITVSIILIATTAVVALVNSDLRSLVLRLQEENARAQDSRQRVEFMALHDALTGLPNRSQARERFADLTARSRRGGKKMAVLYMDLDDFKPVNDTHGHAVGDQLLKAVAERLRGAVRGSDIVCRLGGDEFLLLLDQQADASGVGQVAQKLIEVLAAPVALDRCELETAASIGIAMYPDDGDDFDVLVQRADIAMYKAKDAGRGQFRFFDAEMNVEAQLQAQLAMALRTALARGELELHYQPQFSLASGELLGAEALLRWQHPTLGWVPPSQFIPIAERNGLIASLGQWVLMQACQTGKQWHDAGLGGLVLAVNVSPLQLRRGGLEKTVQDVLLRTGFPARQLELELTESVLLNDSLEVGNSLIELRRLGVGFAIDDFGTGYSNLNYLTKFEVHCIKIDQSFVRRMARSASDAALVRAIIQMSKALSLTTLAEGVEDEECLAQLRVMGCDAAQGFLWSPAMSAEAFLAFAQTAPRLRG